MLPAMPVHPATAQNIADAMGDLNLQRLDHRPKLRVLSGKLLIGRTPIIRHHTMIRIPP